MINFAHSCLANLLFHPIQKEYSIKQICFGSFNYSIRPNFVFIEMISVESEE